MRALLLVPLMLFATPSVAAETRCGWFVNPTPGNAWLIDRHGRWTIGLQGSQPAKGNWPNFSKGQWVRLNGDYGYGCACMSVKTDRRTMTIARIFTARAVPLRQCRIDRRLKRPV
jgi:hypothetical protein